MPVPSMLHWDFFNRNASVLRKNPRIGMAYRNLDRMDPAARAIRACRVDPQQYRSALKAKIEGDVVWFKSGSAPTRSRCPFHRLRIRTPTHSSLAHRARDASTERLGHPTPEVPMGRCARHAPRTPELRYPLVHWVLRGTGSLRSDHDILLCIGCSAWKRPATAGAINAIYGWPTGSENAV